MSLAVLRNNEIPERKTAIGVLLADRLEDPNMSHSTAESQSSFAFGDQSQFGKQNVRLSLLQQNQKVTQM